MSAETEDYLAMYRRIDEIRLASAGAETSEEKRLMALMDAKWWSMSRNEKSFIDALLDAPPTHRAMRQAMRLVDAVLDLEDRPRRRPEEVSPCI